MTFFVQFHSAMLTALFIENIIFTRALGTSWMFYLIRNPKELLKYTGLLMVVTTLSGLLAYPLRGFVYNSEYRHLLLPMLYILAMAIVYIAIYFFIKYALPKQKELFGLNLGVAVFNCATLGGLLVASNERLDLLSTLGYGLTRLEYCRVPKIFRGVPIALIYLGLLSLAFYGLVGHQLPT